MVDTIMTLKMCLPNEIRLKDVVEVFQDYKKSALLLCCVSCDWKCCREAGISNTDAIIFGGLEPLLQIEEVCGLIEYLREHNVKKDILIYTGYYLEEIDKSIIERLKKHHVILKCGRYIPNRPQKFDKILGITLASDNQYGVQL